MKNIMRNALYIQSGGPTTVFNASAYGVITACKASGNKIDRLYCAEHGVMGLVQDRLLDVHSQDDHQMELLKQTPSAIFGSSRYRIPDAEVDDSDYRRVLNTLKKHNIGYIFYNGGNGTLKACQNLINYLESSSYNCRVIAIPNTVDNDIKGIDHTPGFPSAARHVIITVSELAHDIRAYDTGLITVVEVMGRNTGWLAAATLLCTKLGNGPDLIYTPEYVFEPKRFIRDVGKVYEEQGKCLAVVAEGVKLPNGKYLFEYDNEDSNDDPQLNMGGITPYLTRLLRRNFSCKLRGIDLGLMQRCGMHSASPVDVDEAVLLGSMAVEAALQGNTGKMVALRRVSSRPYRAEPVLVELDEAAGCDATMPLKYITANKNFIEDLYLDYIEPLVGELPNYAKLKLDLCS